MRTGFSKAESHDGINSVKSFFEPGEPGHNAKVDWGFAKDLGPLVQQHFVIAYELPIFKSVIEKRAAADGLKVELISLPSARTDIDVQILASGISNGRHLIFQDFIAWPHVSDFLAQAPQTKLRLSGIAEKSASTLPPDNETLKQFEQASFEEQALAPLARKFPIAFSGSKLNLALGWTAKGELTFYKSNDRDSGSTPSAE